MEIKISLELHLTEGADVLCCLLPPLHRFLHEPLYDREYPGAVHALDLMGLQLVGTLHARQDSNYLLC